MWFRQCLSSLFDVGCGGRWSLLTLILWRRQVGVFLWVKITFLGEWCGHQPPFLLQGKGWMLQRSQGTLSSYHQPHRVEGGTDNNLSCNFCFGKSSQGSTALKPSPRPFWRLHYSLRESFGLVPWGNEAFVTLVPVCAHLSPGFPKNFQNPWAILAIWLRVHKHMRLPPGFKCRWAGRGGRHKKQHKPRGTSKEQRSLLGERQMLWGCFSRSWYPMRRGILSPQGKKPWEDYTRPEWASSSLKKREPGWLLRWFGSESFRLAPQELCPPPCTGWWTSDSCLKRGNARVEQKWITLHRRSFNSSSLQETSAFAH